MMTVFQRLSVAILLLVVGVQGAAAEAQRSAQISVLGDGRVAVSPDIVRLSLGVEARAADAAGAMADAGKRLSAVLEALTQSGLEPRDIQTTRYQLDPEYDRQREDGAAPVVVGYVARSQITAVLRDLDTLGDVIDNVIGAGGNRFSGISFDLDDRAQAQAQARRASVKDAMEKATLFADAAGLMLGDVIEMVEGGVSQGPREMPVMAMRSAESMPVAPGEIEVNASITVRFALVKAE